MDRQPAALSGKVKGRFEGVEIILRKDKLSLSLHILQMKAQMTKLANGGLPICDTSTKKTLMSEKSQLANGPWALDNLYC